MKRVYVLYAAIAICIVLAGCVPTIQEGTVEQTVLQQTTLGQNLDWETVDHGKGWPPNTPYTFKCDGFGSKYDSTQKRCLVTLTKQCIEQSLWARNPDYDHIYGNSWFLYDDDNNGVDSGDVWYYYTNEGTEYFSTYCSKTSSKVTVVVEWSNRDYVTKYSTYNDRLHVCIPSTGKRYYFRLTPRSTTTYVPPIDTSPQHKPEYMDIIWYDCPGFAYTINSIGSTKSYSVPQYRAKDTGEMRSLQFQLNYGDWVTTSVQGVEPEWVKQAYLTCALLPEPKCSLYSASGQYYPDKTCCDASANAKASCGANECYICECRDSDSNLSNCGERWYPITSGKCVLGCSNGKCVCPAENKCDPGVLNTRCKSGTTNIVQNCIDSGEPGCYTWRDSAASCGQYQKCENGACVPDCPVLSKTPEGGCVGTSTAPICIDSVPYKCTLKNSCPVWVAQTPCLSGQKCDGGACTADCSISYAGKCTVGVAPVCENGKAKYCDKDATPCPVYKYTDCTAQALECVDGQCSCGAECNPQTYVKYCEDNNAQQHMLLHKCTTIAATNCKKESYIDCTAAGLKCVPTVDQCVDVEVNKFETSKRTYAPGDDVQLSVEVGSIPSFKADSVRIGLQGSQQKFFDQLLPFTKTISLGSNLMKGDYVAVLDIPSVQVHVERPFSVGSGYVVEPVWEGKFNVGQDIKLIVKTFNYDHSSTVGMSSVRVSAKFGYKTFEPACVEGCNSGSSKWVFLIPGSESQQPGLLTATITTVDPQQYTVVTPLSIDIVIPQLNVDVDYDSSIDVGTRMTFNAYVYYGNEPIDGSCSIDIDRGDINVVTDDMSCVWNSGKTKFTCSYPYTYKPADQYQITLTCSRSGWQPISLPYDVDGRENYPIEVKITVDEGCGNGACETGESVETCPADCDNPPIPWLTIFIVGLLVISVIVGVVVFVLRKKR